MNVYRFEIGDSVVKKKEKKKSNSSETESNQSNPFDSKIPNYKISSSCLYWISTWSRNLYTFETLIV